jgi:hypothetical protein
METKKTQVTDPCKLAYKAVQELKIQILCIGIQISDMQQGLEWLKVEYENSKQELREITNSIN